MEQYVSKSALVAEIEKVLNSYDPNEITSGRYALVRLLSFLDTLEVKEPVSEDLEAAARKYAKTKHADKSLIDIVSWDFMTGAQWQKAQTIEKACSFLNHYQEYPNHDIATGSLIEAFKMYMES